MEKGKVLDYVEGAYQSLLTCKNPGGVKKWHQRQRKKFGEQNCNGKKECKDWVNTVKDKKVRQVSEKIQVPLMSQLMRKAGMKGVAFELICKVLTKGAEYIDDVDMFGLYQKLPLEK